MKKALILYASYSGNTAKVAETFKTVLEEFGWGVDMLKVTKRTDKRNLPYRMDDYDLLLAGSPIMAGRPAQEVLECICPEMFHEMHFFATHEDYTRKGIAFVTYGGSGRGPAEAMPSLAYIKMCMEDVRIKGIGQFACCGKELRHNSVDNLGDKLKMNIPDAQAMMSRYKENPEDEEFKKMDPKLVAIIKKLSSVSDDESFGATLFQENDPLGIGKPGQRFWHYDMQIRPHARDLKKAEYFLEGLLEDYLLTADGVSRKPGPVYRNIN